MKDARNIVPTPVRLPPELKRWLQHEAVDNHRSLNGEILHRLELARTQQKAQEAKQ